MKANLHEKTSHRLRTQSLTKIDFDDGQPSERICREEGYPGHDGGEAEGLDKVEGVVGLVCEWCLNLL
jgi:hypothetical protein